ncbi:MAG TPA: FKBP-type peptidyl-prolyl cis-trans isomerase [Burkholderiales bacterium]|nr:FKBP-type peptidyl-prolyl cis-trans isomerase [Burkholderiales bacterium]
MSAGGGGLVTLHYRLSLEHGDELLSTFDAAPATLALGTGELAPGLERCVEQAEPGKRYVFLLEPGQAFGERREELLQALPRSAFPADMALAPGEAVEFSGPEGDAHLGIVLEAGEDQVRVDFNHPLAGRRLRFELEVISVL